MADAAFARPSTRALSARGALAAEHPIRVVVADDHPIILAALEYLFASERDFQIVAYCRDGLGALRAARQENPDILLLDVRLPDIDGLEVMRRLKESGVALRVVLLTASISDDELLDAVRLGLDGLVLKEMALDTLAPYLRSVHRGEQSLDPRLTMQALQKLVGREAGSREIERLLTKRELEIARAVAAGGRNREIADRLNVSEGTVKGHLHHIYEKLNVRTRVELSIYVRARTLR